MALSTLSLALLLACLVALALTPTFVLTQAQATTGSAVAAAVEEYDVPREVHAFFYLWYGEPQTDGRYLHWDHEILQHWTPSVAAQWPKGKFVPPGDVGATYMPARGLYSSNDPRMLRAQMIEARQAGIDVVVASWWPANRPDGQGVDTDRCVPALLDAAAFAGVRVAFHIEPYEGRTPLTVRGDLEYLTERYGTHPALHRYPALRTNPATGTPERKLIPLVYVYDSYLNPAAEWAEVLAPTGSSTIRGTPLDHVVIGLFLNGGDGSFISAAGMDGSYSYFAAEGSSFGSTPRNWPGIQSAARAAGKIFVPCVGPGYDDTRIRPWNGSNKRSRGTGGSYYASMWTSALATDPDIVAITSLNEWGEGTQIEPALPFVTTSGEKLQDYGELGPDMYMELTAKFAKQFKDLDSQTHDEL